MHLIAPLAAGIDGCENGTFDIVLRGTSTPASYYTDFEGNTAPIVGTAVPLDARGGGTFYVNSLVKVTCKSSLGATIREFIAGDAGTAVEVRSDSFTGNAYVGGAAAVGNPTTVAAVLDMWNNSAGCEDFKVLIAGVKTNLSAAFSVLQGQRRFIVTEYGAVGDGVTLNTSAINACISAANAAGGGIVYFPPGTFLTNTVTAFGTVSIEGAGRALTTIRMQTNVALLSGVLPAKMSGFLLNFATAHTTPAIQESSAAVGSLKEIADIDIADNQGTVISMQAAEAHSVSIENCSVQMSAGSSSALLAFNVTNMSVNRCTVTVTGTTNTTAISHAGTGELRVSDCKLDFSSVTTGNKRGIACAAGSPGFINGCDIRPPAAASDWIAIQGPSTAVNFCEYANTLRSTAAALSTTYRCYSVGLSAVNMQLGSRDELTAFPPNPNADPIVLPSNQVGVVYVANTSNASHSGNVQIRGEGSTTPQVPRGSKLVVMVRNTTGGIVTYEWGAEFQPIAGTFTVANNSTRCFWFALDGASWCPIADLAGAQVP